MDTGLSAVPLEVEPPPPPAAGPSLLPPVEAARGFGDGATVVTASIVGGGGGEEGGGSGSIPAGLRAEMRAKRHPSPRMQPSTSTKSVGQAKYQSPMSPQRPVASAGGPESPRSRGQANYKTEVWRERGARRWPDHAKEHSSRRPYQFAKSEEIVPLQRSTENQQGHIPGELWTRSLRTKTLCRSDVAKCHKDVASGSLAATFDGQGSGWTGATNTYRSRAQQKPPVTDWVERPVAVGSLSLNHMDGSRYEMRSTPRDCVPGSMKHLGAPGALSRSGAMTAR